MSHVGTLGMAIRGEPVDDWPASEQSKAPGRFRRPGACCSVLGTRYLVPGTWYLVLDSAPQRVGMMSTWPATMRLVRMSLAARRRSTVVSWRRAISQSESPLRTR